MVQKNSESEIETKGDNHYLTVISVPWCVNPFNLKITVQIKLASFICFIYGQVSTTYCSSAQD
ncbi:MAG: hypothetical protein AB8X85_00290 [Coxiella endosymbiont of Dermacentor silvarum]